MQQENYLTREALQQELWNMLPDNCKKIMEVLKETYIESLMADIDSYCAGQHPSGCEWVKATDKLPLHKAFWNIEDGFKKDCSFPVRIDGEVYGMAELYDNRKEGAPDPIYYLVVKGDFGKEYYEDEFNRFEWLSESPSKEGNKGREVDGLRLLEFISEVGWGSVGDGEYINHNNGRIIKEQTLLKEFNEWNNQQNRNNENS